MDLNSFLSGFIFSLTVIDNLDIETKDDVILQSLKKTQFDLGSILDIIDPNELVCLCGYISKYFDLNESDSKLLFFLGKDNYYGKKMEGKQTQSYVIGRGDCEIKLSQEQIKRYLPFLKIENLI